MASSAGVRVAVPSASWMLCVDGNRESGDGFVVASDPLNKTDTWKTVGAASTHGSFLSLISYPVLRIALHRILLTHSKSITQNTVSIMRLDLLAIHTYVQMQPSTALDCAVGINGRHGWKWQDRSSASLSGSWGNNLCLIRSVRSMKSVMRSSAERIVEL